MLSEIIFGMGDRKAGCFELRFE